MSRPQIIHSGHFMVSEPHADLELDAGGRAVVGSMAEQVGAVELRAGGWREGAGAGEQAAVPGDTYDFDTVNACTCRTYRFGPCSSGALSIDASLTKLFECMTLAYSGKIVSPKWKTFKGLKLLPRDKIRLNNAIWRAWYLQYVERRKNPVCNFVTPLECSVGDDHRKPEPHPALALQAVIMEGKYWKHQIGVVIREYHKWRTYFCTRVQKKKDKPESLSTQEAAHAIQGKGLSSEAKGSCPMELDLDTLDSLISDLADTIFYSRNPYGGPNPRSLDFFAACRPQPVTQASTLLPAAAPQGSLSSACDLDVTTNTKELPLHRGSLTPLSFPLDLEPLTPLNGHETFLPLFPTSPLRVSPPPPGPPTQHPQPTVVFSVITHTAAEKPPSSTRHPPSPGGTFAMPVSGPLPNRAKSQQLQHIAPAPTSSHPPAAPSAFLTRLLIAGPSTQPLAPARDSSQVCTPLELPAGVLLMEKPIHPCSVTASSSTDAKSEDRAERRGPHASHQPCSLPSTKGSRRPGFTSADHARRLNISCAFDTLASLVLPGLAQPSVKLSKATLLQRSVVYVGRLQQERRQVQETARRLQGEIEELSAAIGEFQRQLPPSGAPVTPPRLDHMAQLYDDYVRQRTLQNWRFWLFSMLVKPLFESYRGAVSTHSAKEFCQSVLGWLEQHCTLPMLRPAISSSLLQLSKFTAILTQPSRLPEQALQAVCHPSHSKGHS
ncbi:carbohydrate-responsive element-binding protein-like isoform X4 [Gopherus flavomarginatus]|uniref:carbohydrate-responsive element-binding protein-like isoform X4 n=1 Tax=Gopherus flavomarginatus TaxID=286002 RepID=UPI0021CC3E91|nr:carbohydrate-responsive element-binding protein-like isoform X4 [Gopherus flavomarginatus]